MKLTPAAAPPAGSGYEIDFAPSSIRLMASGVEMSGRGAPVRTATPTATVASGVALAATTWPDASTSGNGGCTIGTSNGSPFATCRFVPSPEPNVAFTLWPVFFSNAGINFSTAAWTPPGPTSVISSARAAGTQASSAAPTMTMPRVLCVLGVLCVLRRVVIITPALRIRAFPCGP